MYLHINSALRLPPEIQAIYAVTTQLQKILTIAMNTNNLVCVIDYADLVLKGIPPWQTAVIDVIANGNKLPLGDGLYYTCHLPDPIVARSRDRDQIVFYQETITGSDEKIAEHAGFIEQVVKLFNHGITVPVGLEFAMS